MGSVPTVKDALDALATAVANHGKAVQGAREAGKASALAQSPAPPTEQPPTTTEGTDHAAH